MCGSRYWRIFRANWALRASMGPSDLCSATICENRLTRLRWTGCWNRILADIRKEALLHKCQSLSFGFHSSKRFRRGQTCSADWAFTLSCYFRLFLHFSITKPAFWHQVTSPQGSYQQSVNVLANKSYATCARAFFAHYQNWIFWLLRSMTWLFQRFSTRAKCQRILDFDNIYIPYLTMILFTMFRIEYTVVAFSPSSTNRRPSWSS